MPEFYMILARKIIKIPEFLWYLPEIFLQNSRISHDFCPKMPEFYVIIARKIFLFFFPNFRGARAPPPATPVSYAYANELDWSPCPYTPPTLSTLTRRNCRVESRRRRRCVYRAWSTFSRSASSLSASLYYNYFICSKNNGRSSISNLHNRDRGPTPTEDYRPRLFLF